MNCIYWLKAEFPNAKHLKKVFPEIKKLWQQGVACEEWYQKHRGCAGDNYKKPNRVAIVKFWAEFQIKFPLVAEMLVGAKDGGHVNGKWKKNSLVLSHDPNNSLSSHVNFGSDDDLKNLYREVNELRFEAEVWRCADWTPLCQYLKKKFGAVKAGSVSEEDISMTEAADNAMVMS